VIPTNIDTSSRSRGIRTPDQRVRVFVSSTLAELAAERAVVRAAIEQLQLVPVMFESGARPHPARDLYRAYLEQSDLFVGIYWQQYGWVGPEMTVSGLEDEFLLSARLPRLLYVKRPAPAADPGLRRMLDGIRAEGQLSYKPFTDAAELHDLVVSDLASLLAERFAHADDHDPTTVLPSPVTELVGRDHDIAAVTAILESPGHRLAVLTGTGGIGKTRLALAIAERSKGDWPDGVAFVDLSAVTVAESVPVAITSALQLVPQGQERPVETLGRRLAGLRMLLILDNFEQVLGAAPIVADLLRRAATLRIMVTSRVVLRLRGEQEWRVEPLSVDSPGHDPADVPAVQLFVDRVRDARPDFVLTDENAPAISELCRRLDGIPLALELAAAWMRVLTPEQMLVGLYDRIERPGALADLPDRQQTLTATLTWSYDLLPESAQQLLTRLSVFAAPFTLDGAEDVGRGEGSDALGALSTLLDHSMVSHAQRPDGQPAFRLLDPVRRFAAGSLVALDETMDGLAQHLVGVLAPASAQHGSPAWAMRRLDSEEPNVQAVLRWSADRLSPAVRLIECVGNAWVWMLVRGLLRSGSELRQHVEAVPLEQLTDERDRLARQWMLVQGLMVDGRYDDAGQLLDSVMPALRRLASPSRRALVLNARAISRSYSPGSPARAELEEALGTARDSGDPIVLGYVLSHYGLFLCADGDVEHADVVHTEMLALTNSLDDDNQRAEAHYDLAVDALTSGRLDQVQPHIAAASSHYQHIDNREGLARSFAALSGLALLRENAQLAAWLTGAAGAVRHEFGLSPWPTVAEVERRVTDRIEVQLSSAVFHEQLISGGNCPTEEVLTRALAALRSTGTTAP
jgi:predicted ATPase